MDKLDMISYLNDEKTVFYNHHQQGDAYQAATMHIYKGMEDKVKELETKVARLEAKLTKEAKSKAA
ncbi:MAG: hypothetical protein AAB316_20780 [Bacteroidota bacterium]